MTGIDWTQFTPIDDEGKPAAVKPVVDWGQFTPLDVAKPVEHNPLAEVADYARSGIEAGKRYLFNALVPDTATPVNDEVAQGLGYQNAADYGRHEQAQVLAQSARREQALEPQSPEMLAGQQALAKADRTGDYGEVFKAILTHPRAAAAVTAKSLGMAAPGMVAAGASGPAMPLVVGATSALTDYQSTLEDQLTAHGVDMTDPVAVRHALESPEIMAQSREFADKHAIPVTMFDVLTAGLAGRLIAGARGGRVGAAAAAGGETLGQMAGGAAGEALGELNSEGRVSSPLNVVMEAVGEAPTEITEAPAGYREALKNGDRQRSSAISVDHVHADYQDLADTYGATVTSRTRTPEHNREVGGVANSQHLTGTAWDFVVPGAARRAFKADARARGYQVIDEGDHIHLELPGHHQRIEPNVGEQAANITEPDRLGRVEPTLDLEARKRRRDQLVQQGEMAPGAAAAEGFLDEARSTRDMPLDGEAQTPERAPDKSAPVASSLIDDLLARHQDAVTRANDNALLPLERSGWKAQAQQLAVQLDQARAARAAQVESTNAALLDALTAPMQLPPAPAPVQAPPVQSAPEAAQVAPQAPSAPAPDQAPTAGAAAPVASPAPVSGGPASTPAMPAPAPSAPPAQVAPSPEAVGAAPASPPPAAPASPTPEPAVPGHPYDYQPGAARVTKASELMRNRINDNPRMLRQLQTDPATQSGPGRLLLRPEQVREVTLPKPRQRQLDRLGAVLGRKIVPVHLDTPGHITLSGFAFDNHHIFVNLRSARASHESLIALAGHEFLHTLRNSGNHDLEALLAFARSRVNPDNPYVRNMTAAYTEAGLYDGLDMHDAMTEEFVADMAGDMLADPAFWEDLAREDAGLFRRTLSRFLDFLREIAARARKLGDEQAFTDIEQVRQRLARVLSDHIGRVRVAREQVRETSDRAHLAASPEDERAAQEFADTQRMREESDLQRAHAYLQQRDYHNAVAAAGRHVSDHVPPLPAHSPELRQFLSESSTLVNPNRSKEATIYTHGTAREIDKFQPKQGEAVFMAKRASFTGPFAAAAAHYVDANEPQDVEIGGISMKQMRDNNPVGSVDWMTADLLLNSRTTNPVYGALGALPDYVYEDAHGNLQEPNTEEADAIHGFFDSLIAQEEAGQRTVRRTGGAGRPGMTTMPLITNASKPFDFEDGPTVSKLMRVLRSDFTTIKEFAKASHHGVSSWEEVEQIIKSKGDNWSLLESRPVLDAIKDMGYDSYFVSEMGHKNLAVFDPKKVKAPFANVGPFGTRAPTAEEAAQLGMTLEEALAAQRAGDVRLSLNRTLMRTFTQPLATTNKAVRDGLERWLFDEYRDLKEIQRDIAHNVFAGRLPANFDAHRNENLRHGAYVDASKRAEARFIAPISRVLTKAGYSLDDFSRYLWWRHAPERDAYLRSKLGANAQNVPADGLAGISPADARANIAALDPAKRAAFERAAKFIDGMRKFTLETMLDAGLISQDYHDNVLKQYQHYVPLRGLPDGSEEVNRQHFGAKSGLGMSQRGLGPRATGRASEPSNIIEEMMRDMDSALVGVQKQRVLASLVRLIAAHPDPALWEISPVDATRKWVNGVLTVVQTNGVPEDQLTFMHKGIPVKIEIRHEGLRKAMLNLNRPMPELLRAVGRLTRWLSAVKTSFSPFFLLINPVRDAQLASMGLVAEHGMKAVEDVAKFYPHAYTALARDDAHRKVTPHSNPLVNQLQQYAREFSSVGGKTGYTYVGDIREQHKKLRHLLDRYADSKGMKDILAGNFHSKDAFLLVRKAQQHVANLFEVANDMAENSTRLSVYAAMREKGLSVEDAAAYAKEVTVNFNRRGILARYIGPFYMFFNASVQGGARVGRLMANKKFAAMMGGLSAMSYTIALASMFAGGDDDDGESRYLKAVSDQQAQRYIPVWLGKDKSLNLPVPYGPNIFTYAGWRLAKMTYLLAQGREDHGVVGDLAMQMANSMSPIDPSKGVNALLPEALRIPAQVRSNKNDFGSPISRRLDERDKVGNPNYLLTDNKTAAPFRFMARVLSEWTGGNKYEGGAVNLTGEQVKYLYDELGGGLARFGEESAGVIENLLAGIDPEPSDIPLSNIYFRGKGDRQVAGSYYDNLADYENTVADWKLAVANDDQAKMDELVKHAPWIEGAELDASTAEGRAAQAGSVMAAKRETDRQLKSLNQQKDAILAGTMPNEDGTPMTFAQRKQAAALIDQQIASVQGDFNYAINAGRGYLPTQGGR